MMVATRPLTLADWAFEECAPEDRARIERLTAESARYLWDTWVSADAPQRHPMLLAKPHWLDAATPLAVRWDVGDAEALAAALAREVPWHPELPVYFIAMRERASRAPWAVFLRTASDFLREDNELSFLCADGHPQFFVFPPTGAVLLGHGRPS
jgi:hypothetical protein